MPLLELRVCGARNLPNLETFGKTDPFCTVSLEGKQWRTKTIENNLDPEWNDVFKFHVADPDSSRIHFVVWDDNMTGNAFVGEYYLSISGLQRGVVEDKWVLLQNCKKNAELHIRFKADDFGADAQVTSPHPEYRPSPVPQGYPPQQGGYPPQQGGYPPQQGGYPPQQGGYPPQQGGYPPQQGGYPPQQGGYPPQQGGYPPQQGGYPPQQGGYPPQQGGYPPQQGGYPPQQGGYPPQQQQQHHHQHHHETSSDTMRRGQRWNVGHSIKSSDGRYTMVLQGDGNLVLYEGSRPHWASNTCGQQVSHGELTEHHFALYGPQGQIVWKQDTHGADRLVMQNDRNFVAYRSDNHPTWASNTCH